jgi:GT2 family glycosyltransferase
MRVSVIIIHFGRLSVTQECVASLLKFEKNIHQIIVVNNAAESISGKDFGEKNNIIVLNRRENVGFAKGVNIGIDYALKHNAEGILLLNNDTIITKPFILPLVNALGKNKIGIVSPVIQFEKNKKKIYDLGGYYNRFFGRTHHNELTCVPKTTQYLYPDYVSGCCMLIHSEVFHCIGYFDEQFFLYYEDVDFCIRAKASGYKIAVVTQSKINHLLSKSVGKVSYLSTYHQIRSAIFFGKKYFRAFPKNILNKLFIILQVVLFVKANPHGGLGGIKALLTSSKENK